MIKQKGREEGYGQWELEQSASSSRTVLPTGPARFLLGFEVRATAFGATLFAGQSVVVPEHGGPSLGTVLHALLPTPIK